MLTPLRPLTAACAAVLYAAAPNPVAAQSLAPGGPLTLEQVLELAESRSEAIAAARAGIRRAEGNQVRARSGLYPQLSAFASYDRALASEFEGIFDSAAPPCPPFAPNPAAPLGERVSEIERALDCGAIGNPFFARGGDNDQEDGGAELPFGRENTWRLNLSFSQNLYSGGRIGAQAALAAAARGGADLALTAARAQLLYEVTQAYYDAALARQLAAIAQSTLEQADATFRQVEAGFTAGAQPEFELLRARVSRDNQRPQLVRMRAVVEIALLRLKQLLDLPADASLRLAETLDGDVLPPPPSFAPALADAEVQVAAVQTAREGERTAVKEAAVLVDISEAALRAARAERMPAVTVSSTYGRVAYPSGFFPGFGDFRTNWSVGASVQVPILTGGRLRGDEIVARAELEETEARLQQTRELAALDTRSAWAELAAAQAAWEASAGTVQQAVRAHEIAEVRYRSGVSPQLELSDARLLLQQAEANRAQAARDLQVARARIALLPGLPLSQPGAAGAGTLPRASGGAAPGPSGGAARPGLPAVGPGGFQQAGDGTAGFRRNE